MLYAGEDCWPASAPRPGWDVLSLPSQQREKRFLELLAAPRAWLRLQPQPQQLSELVSLSCSCTAQEHLLSPGCRVTPWEHVFPGWMPSLLPDLGQEAAVLAKGTGITKAHLCPVEPVASVGTRLAAPSACKPAPPSPYSSCRCVSSSFLPLLPTL